MIMTMVRSCLCTVQQLNEVHEHYAQSNGEQGSEDIEAKFKQIKEKSQSDPLNGVMNFSQNSGRLPG